MERRRDDLVAGRLPPPDDDDVGALLRQCASRALRLLRRELDEDQPEADAMAALEAASLVVPKQPAGRMGVSAVSSPRWVGAAGRIVGASLPDWQDHPTKDRSEAGERFLPFRPLAGRGPVSDTRKSVRSSYPLCSG